MPYRGKTCKIMVNKYYYGTDQDVWDYVRCRYFFSKSLGVHLISLFVWSIAASESV